jgi:hypothetical protein
MRRLAVLVLGLLFGGLLLPGAAMAEKQLTIGILPFATQADRLMIRGSAPHGAAVKFLVNDHLQVNGKADPRMDIYHEQVQLEPGENHVRVELVGTDETVKATIYRTTVTFADVKDHQAAQDIEVLATLGVIDGTGQGLFSPEATLTRAQFAKLMVLGLSLPSPGKAAGPIFTDQSAIPAWADPYIQSAVAAGLFQGYPDGSFRPNAPLTQVEVAVITGRGLRLKSVAQVGAPRPFADEKAIPNWARPDIDLATSTGVIGEFWGKSFKGEKQASRALAASVVRRLMSKSTGYVLSLR